MRAHRQKIALALGGVAGLASATLMLACAGGETEPTIATTTTTVATTASGGAGGEGGAGGAGGTAGGGGTPDTCGDGVRQAWKACDGEDFGDATCESVGLGAGTLACTLGCGLSTLECMPAEHCFDGIDNDNDGSFDCEEPSCAGFAGCADSCAAPRHIFMAVNGAGDTQFLGANLGHASTIAASCTPAPADGPEFVFSFEAPETATLTVDLIAWGFDASVSVRSDCGDASSELACRRHARNPNGFGGGSVRAPVTEGQTYFIVIDGASADDVGRFDIWAVVGAVPDQEQGCGQLSGFDSDYDGYFGCEDPDCAALPECTTTGTVDVGQPCSLDSECIAGAAGPVCLAGVVSDLNWTRALRVSYCSRFCDVQAQDCGGDAVCVDGGVAYHHGVCFDGCVQDADCAAGYACIDQGLPSKICLLAPETACTNDFDDNGDGLADCADPDCQVTSECTPGVFPLGDPCGQPSDCATTDGAHDPYCYYGVCSQYCDPRAPNCGPDAICILSMWSGGGTCAALCTATCASCQTAPDGYPSPICAPP